MEEAIPSGDPRHREMLSAMTECAFELAQAAGEIARRARDDRDISLFLKATAEFQRCFFAVRMGIRLSHWGVSGMGAARPASSAEPREHERPEAAEAPEREETPEREESPDRLEVERERDRDYEPVSLPRFLKSLGLVAASAERRRDQLPPHIRDTTLPTLRNLLERATGLPDGAAPKSSAPKSSALAVLAKPPAAPAARSRLLTSTVTPRVTPLRRGLSRRRPSG